MICYTEKELKHESNNHNSNNLSDISNDMLDREEEMKLIIDIPDKAYNEYREGVMSMENDCIIGNAVFDGIPYEERSQGDSISREALKEVIDKITWYHINPHGELTEGAHGEDDALFKAEDIFNAIDNAPTVKSYTLEDLEKAKNNSYKWGRIDGKKERPQAFINGIVEIINKNGITTIDELLKALKGGAE